MPSGTGCLPAIAFGDGGAPPVKIGAAAVKTKDQFLACTGTLHLKETFDSRHHLTSIYQLDGDVVEDAKP
jgi:hypothetical protein